MSSRRVARRQGVGEIHSNEDPINDERLNMKSIAGKVAVVTGGASGIGRAVAARFAAAGANVVIADIEQGALDQTVDDFGRAGHAVLGVRCDVSDGDSVQALADLTIAKFGAVHILHNNAGVGIGGPIWTHSTADWEWVLGVNLWGVIHGIRVFVPLMIEQGLPAHVVNTASMAGLISVPNLAAYNVSKHSVVTMSETLARDLAIAGHDIGVSVLCPGLVSTNIFESQRNRPPDLTATADDQVSASLEGMMSRVDKQAHRDASSSFNGMITPDAVANDVFDAIIDERFYILTHPESTHERVRTRMNDIVEDRQPSPLGGPQ